MLIKEETLFIIDYPKTRKSTGRKNKTEQGLLIGHSDSCNPPRTTDPTNNPAAPTPNAVARTFCTRTSAVESSGTMTMVKMAATRSGSEMDASTDGDTVATDSSKLRRPSSSAFENRPNFSTDDSVTPNCSALF